MFLVNDVTDHFCVRQNAQHVIRPTFISDEVKLSSNVARKGSWLSVNDKEGHIFRALRDIRVSLVGLSA